MPFVLTCLGSSPHLAWLAARLNRRAAGMEGCTQVCLCDREGWEQLFRQGLPCGSVVLDASTDWFMTLPDRHESCRQAQCRYAEIAGPWHPFGEQAGFALAWGAATEHTGTIRPCLDRLAPFAGAAVHVGPPGAGSFCRHVRQGIEHVWLVHAQAACEPASGPFIQRWRDSLLNQRTHLQPLLDIACLWLDQPYARPDCHATRLARWLAEGLPLLTQLDEQLAAQLAGLPVTTLVHAAPHPAR